MVELEGIEPSAVRPQKAPEGTNLSPIERNMASASR
jgi:hypothetical protein